ncbi:MAG: helix-turn-helix domain-containing protein [Beijerinckiaceae bacterium]|jgi:excisionase family DNA binding protein|nr:helix-turn-helix domain-containing protein [Beijerinckiaceae bacterium]
MPKRPSWRGIKIHRSYTIEEVARQLSVAKGTVQRWLKTDGLPAMKDQRPFLIHGQDLIDFLKRDKRSGKKCKLHEAYCFSCREPREPAERMADLVAISDKIGDLQALCSHCGGLIHKRVSMRMQEQLGTLLDLTIRQRPSPIGK